jgi:hypothetical protein
MMVLEVFQMFDVDILDFLEYLFFELATDLAFLKKLAIFPIFWSP